MALIFLGAAIILAGNHMGTLAILWVVIAIGWFGTSMWLWRQHSAWISRPPPPPR